MIRVLHIVFSLEVGGGVQQLLLNYYTHINRDSITFDFIVHDKTIGELEKHFTLLKSKIYHVTPKRVSLRKNIKEMNEIIKRGSYDVIHCHQDLSNCFALYLAWKNKVRIRISHAHSCFIAKNMKLRMRNTVLRLLNTCFANYFFACSKQAGNWLH